MSHIQYVSILFMINPRTPLDQLLNALFQTVELVAMFAAGHVLCHRYNQILWVNLCSAIVSMITLLSAGLKKSPFRSSREAKQALTCNLRCDFCSMNVRYVRYAWGKWRVPAIRSISWIQLIYIYINNAYKWSDKWSESVKKHRGGTTDGTRLQALVPWWRRSASVRDIRLCLAMLWRWVLRRTGLDKLRRYHKHVAIWENDENVSSQGRRKLFRSSNLVYDRAHLTLEKCHSCFESRV